MTVEERSRAASAPASERSSDRHAVPIFEARPGGPADRFAARFDSRHPALVFFLALLGGLPAAGRRFDPPRRCSSSTCCFPPAGSGSKAPTRASTTPSPNTAPAPSPTIAEVGSQVGGAPVLPILVGIVALVCAFLRRWLIAAFAAFVLAVESATYRVTSLAVPARPPLGPPPRRPAGRRQLPLGPHRRLGRGLLRPGPAPHHPLHQQPEEGAGLDRPRSSSPPSSPSRACTRGCTTRSTSPAASSSASARSWCCCSPAAPPARPRRGARAHEGRGRRACRQNVRRAGSRSCAARSPRRASPTPLWTEVPKSKRAPAAVEQALEDGAELILAWGGDGMVRRCVNALEDTQVPLAIAPRGDLEPVRHQPRHRARHRPGGPGRAARRPPPAGRRPLRRGALRRDGRGRLRRGDDQGRRRPQGPPRPGGLRARRGREAERPGLRSEDRDRRRRAGTRAPPAASSSATSANCSAASRCSPTPVPTTACSTSACSPPRVR